MKFTYNGETLDSELLKFSDKQQAYVNILESVSSLLISTNVQRMKQDELFAENMEKILTEFIGGKKDGN